MDTDDNGGNNTRCEWVMVTETLCWVLGSASLPFSLSVFVFLFFSVYPNFGTAYLFYSLFFFASSCCGVERQPSIHTALPQTVNKSRLLQRLFVLTNSLYEVELQRQLKAAAAYVAICPCPVPASQAHVFFVISFLYPATFENCQKGVSQLYANVCDR